MTQENAAALALLTTGRNVVGGGGDANYYMDQATERAMLCDQLEALTKSKVNQSIERLANTSIFMTVLKFGTGILVTGIGLGMIAQTLGEFTASKNTAAAAPALPANHICNRQAAATAAAAAQSNGGGGGDGGVVVVGETSSSQQ